MNMTDYDLVCEFNKCFDFPVYNNLSDEKCRNFRLDLIEEELNELKTAYDNNDVIEEKDACADILYVAYGMAYTYNINSNNEFKKIYPSFALNNYTLFQNLSEFYEYQTKLNRPVNLEKLFEIFNNLKLYTNQQNLELMNENLHELIFYVYNFQYISNYDSDKIFKIVHDSNMSKLCKNEEEAQLTVIDYNLKYLNGKSPYDSPYYYKLENGLYVVKNKSTGKALKSINYNKVKLI